MALSKVIPSNSTSSDWVNFELIKKIPHMFKIAQNQGKVAAIGIQSVIICEITNVWLFNDKKNVINKNIEK